MTCGLTVRHDSRIEGGSLTVFTTGGKDDEVHGSDSGHGSRSGDRAAGTTIAYTYDKQHRLASADYSAAQADAHVAYQYDAANNLDVSPSPTASISSRSSGICPGSRPRPATRRLCGTVVAGNMGTACG